MLINWKLNCVYNLNTTAVSSSLETEVHSILTAELLGVIVHS